MANLINLTPHEINVINSDKIPPSGKVARVDMVQKTAGVINGVQLYSPTFGDVVDLPEPQSETFYIVSALVRSAVPDRFDVLSPGNLIRDNSGNVIGCDSFHCNSI